MHRISYIRLASYLVLCVAFWLYFTSPRTIPVRVEAGERERAEVAAFRENLRLVGHKGFLDAKLSGREVFAIADRLAHEHGLDLARWEPPLVHLRLVDGRILWSIAYYPLGRPPGGYFGISIDDATGATEFSEGTEGPNQPPQRNAGNRPFSDDSPVSETPSSLGPRG